MNPPNLTTKFLSITLSTLLFIVNSVLAGATESNFWKERQINSQKKDGKPAQFASLPASMLGKNLNNPKELLRQFPALHNSLETAARSQANPTKFKLPSSVAPYIEAIPLHSALVKDLYINKRGDAPNKPMVLLIQDVHLNNEAQQNISNVLLALNEQASQISPTQPLLVGVEGAFGPFDFTRFRAFEDKDIVKAVADYFLKENKFAAPSYVGITAKTPATSFYGIDDVEHYTANVEAYRSSQLLKKATLATLEIEKRSLVEIKQAGLNPELKKFDSKRSAYLSGSSGFGDFVSYLSRTADSMDVQAEGQELVLELFLAAYEIEKSLDFQKVERERTIIVEKLATKLTAAEINQLVAQGLAYRMGRISFAGYYKAIKSLIVHHNISLSETPSFDTYIRYVLLSDGIQAEQLMASIQRLEERVMRGLCQSEKEKELMDQSRSLYLVEKLLDFGLTPEEWNDYRKPVHRRWSINHGLNLSAFEKFYEEADIRSDRMIGNLLS